MRAEFKATTGFRLATLLAIAAVPFAYWVGSLNGEGLLAMSIPATLAIGQLIALPRTICLDEVGIHQRSFWGLERCIPWPEVDSFVPIGFDGNSIVGGGDVEISHGSLHADKQRFCRLVGEYANRPLSEVERQILHDPGKIPETLRAMLPKDDA